MKWQNLRRSDNVEDQRAVSGKTMALGGGGIIGIIVIALLVKLMGGDPSQVVQQLSQQQQGAAQPAGQTQFSPEEQQLADFVSAILGDTEDVWSRQFQQMGREYQKPKLVL